MESRKFVGAKTYFTLDPDIKSILIVTRATHNRRRPSSISIQSILIWIAGNNYTNANYNHW